MANRGHHPAGRRAARRKLSLTMKRWLLACALTLGAAAPASPVAAQAAEFVCTEIVGYSQTMQWFFEGFAPTMGRARWQLRWQGGASIDAWADPGFVGWTGQGLATGCAQGSSAPDRVLLDISDGFQTDVDWWVRETQAAINNVRRKYPGVRQIILQPVVGGPSGGTCTVAGQTVRASANHPYVKQAIARLVGGEVVAGAAPTVRSCSDYEDSTGHLTNQAKGPIGVSIASFYANGGTIAPAPAPVPAPGPAPAPEPMPVALPAPFELAPFCEAGQVPLFAFGFARLASALGPVMGEPIACEHGNPENGDTLQETTTGLAYYSISSNTPEFTDGYTHWAFTPEGEFIAWTNDG
jgi:hypothetical protein